MIFTTVSTRDEVEQMLRLQAANHSSTVNADTQREQGFLTVRHDPEVLWAMNQAAPSVIAKDGDQVAGYCLVMPRSFRTRVPILEPMFELLETLTWRDRPLKTDPRWFVMGQVCVAEGYRGQGVFDGMYRHLAEVCRPDYDFVVTEVAERNTRSMRAHARVGFETFHVYEDAVAGEHWAVVGWRFC